MKKLPTMCASFNLTKNDKRQNLECGNLMLPKMLYET